jgi:2,4-dienoyl-CoA reductase-like NADH-dependent reductase (Old Yellow Enzyme family)
MNNPFETASLGSLTLSNRFVRSATWEGMATEQGGATAQLVDTLTGLARGGVGLIITSHTFVSKQGQASPYQLGLHHDRDLNSFRELADGIHQNDGKAVVQLSHAGHFAVEKLAGETPCAVSDFEGLSRTPRKELTEQDIQNLIRDFSEAAGRARQCGFDGVQLHSAHGYLLSQFLSPWFNRRRDRYGGSLENRIRIHLEIYQAVKKRCGDNFPVLIKMNCQDFSENGLTLKEALEAAACFSRSGFDAVEISGGLLTSGKLSPTRPGRLGKEDEGYFKEEARQIKKELSIPLILVGGIRSYEVALALLESDTADFISMSRPFIREPDLINRWKTGQTARSSCVSDNLCFRPGMRGKGIYCVTEEKENRKT